MRVNVKRRTKRGKRIWVVDWLDRDGKRHQPQYRTREEADAAANVLRSDLKACLSVPDPDLPADLTWNGLFHRVMLHRKDLKPRSREGYDWAHTHHIAPAFGVTTVRDLAKARHRFKAFLRQKRTRYARNTVRLIHATLHVVFEEAVDDGLIAANPVVGLAKRLKLGAKKAQRQQNAKQRAMTREQRDAFLAAAAQVAPWWTPMWTVGVLTGLRPGELYALEENDLDLEARTLTVVRALSDDGKRVDTPKDDETRPVHLTAETVRVLRAQVVRRREEKLRRGWPTLPRPVFCSMAGTYADPADVRRAFRKVCKAAGLVDATGNRAAFTPHGLRHTYASLLLQDGAADVYYVQRMLGHADITLTAGTYGNGHEPARRPNLDGLDPGPTTTEVQA